MNKNNNAKICSPVKNNTLFTIIYYQYVILKVRYRIMSGFFQNLYVSAWTAGQEFPQAAIDLYYKTAPSKNFYFMLIYGNTHECTSSDS